ncbi:50S ribosomal protein L29 [Desulfomicrobium orale]|uniref:Large ribosomal subunit protein uL29 n=1 Tax=Desulfomicrobium orale DSM 12838 TaxID=888061 RepID=A0A120KMQ2_9BACT|nr:50S ribosomal protein L29 [Desulfomicrobium orale]AMD91835.1 50S ribosomal protein L29 [Desulfomicrobium orale DSM 12838]MDO4767163.1 50S ribosomal protein L29 [Pseudomonadota bacterium]
MNAQQLRDLDSGKLQEKLAEFRQELMNLRFQHATAQLENTQRVPLVKKSIARILTILKEKDMETGDE